MRFYLTCQISAGAKKRIGGGNAVILESFCGAKINVIWVPIIIVSNTLRGRVQVNDARRLPFGSKTESTPKLKIIEWSLKLLGFNDVDAFLLNQMLCKKTSLPREKLRSVTGPVKAFPLL